MQEELNQFERIKVWNLVPRPNDHSIIGTKWIFRNKMDKHSNIVRNKGTLVAQGYSQEERIDYEKTYALVAKIKSNYNVIGILMFQEFQTFSNGCQECFSKWIYK